ncbi:MAG: hypothetical protein V3T05_10850, partial [Myxococcota bacterium]
DGTVVGEYWHGVQVPFSTLLFAWYRRGYIEKAYRRAYLEVFRQLAADIARDGAKLDALARGIEPPNGEALGALADLNPISDALADLPDPPGISDHGNELPAPDGVEASDGMPGPTGDDYFYIPEPVRETGGDAMTLLPHEGFHVITGADVLPFDATWLGALKLLGGVEVAGFMGNAHVSSRAIDQDGTVVEAASGNAPQNGWRISLYSAPESTGFFVYPTAGYMQQKIGNVDIKSALADLNPINAGRGDIPALASDPDTGVAVDPGTANVYHLDIRSAYVGARAGLDLVAGNDSFVFFASATVGINLGEYRQITAELDECGSDVDPAECISGRNAFEFLRSGAAGGTIGFKLPKIHTAVRLIFDYELYRKFRYSRALKVRGPAYYDAKDLIFKHSNLDIRAAELSAWNFQLSGALVF